MYIIDCILCCIIFIITKGIINFNFGKMITSKVSSTLIIMLKLFKVLISTKIISDSFHKIIYPACIKFPILSYKIENFMNSSLVIILLNNSEIIFR